MNYTAIIFLVIVIFSILYYLDKHDFRITTLNKDKLDAISIPESIEPVEHIEISNNYKNKPNDKLILVKNIDKNLLIKTIQEFTDLYNQEDDSFLNFLDENNEGPSDSKEREEDLEKDDDSISLKISFFPNNQHIITFQNNSKAIIVHYLMDYLAQIVSGEDLLAWHTKYEEDSWISPIIGEQELMIYVIEKKHVDIYATTIDNKAYIIDFSADKKHQYLDQPIIPYIERPFNIDELSEFENIIIS